MLDIKGIFRRFYFSFPVQLVVLHFKKNQILLLYWLVLFGFVTSSIANKWGIPYLFLDPEYVGKVGFWSFFILGISVGGFIMAFNVSSYILNGFRFPFLATLARPFLKYTLNNSIIPLSFLIVYLYELTSFQFYNEYQYQTDIYLQILGFLSGITLIVFITLSYFFKTNKDIFKMYPIEANSASQLTGTKKNAIEEALKTNIIRKKSRSWRVETYLSGLFKIRLVRGTDHYDRDILMAVFKQNHFNAAIIEIIVFIIFISLGLFRDYPFFRIPAGASIILLFSIFIMLFSALRFWLRNWSTTVLISLFLLLNFLSQFEFFNQRNKAFGLNYHTSQAPYNLEALRNSCSSSLKDFQHTITILEKWKTKATVGGQKPKMIFINTSGGGLRSASWTFSTLQILDSTLEGKLFKHTQLITGSSGGIIGASYYRELYLQHQKGLLPSLGSDVFFYNMAKDLLNPIAFSVTVSDLFLNVQRFRDGNYVYTKDRSYAFEKQLAENTNYIFDKRLLDYKNPEAKSTVPMLILTPTIVSDGRTLFISPQPLSYLVCSTPNENFKYKSTIDGVEFTRFFERQDANNIRFISALRMSATFPYVLPDVSLPSIPTIEVMDAGVRDNFGIRTSLKFLYVFREWIEKNTDGVIFIQIRDTPKEPAISEGDELRTILQNITSPIGSFYGNFAKIQDYNNDDLFKYANSWLKQNINFISFELPQETEKISLSWHLTTREKNYIRNAIQLPKNQQAVVELKKALSVP